MVKYNLFCWINHNVFDQMLTIIYLQFCNPCCIGFPIDMWACGVVLYVLLCGYVPFHHPDQNVLFNRIRHGKFIFHHEYWSHISNEAKTLIRQLLVVDPSVRLTVEQALQHPWLQGA